MKINNILLLLAFMAAVSSCKKDDDAAPEPCDNELSYYVNEAQLSADIAGVDEFLLEAGIIAEVDTTGLRYVIQEMGSGISPQICDEIAVVYTGRLMSDSTVFDTVSGPVKFKLSSLISGWKIGLPKINKGGRIQMFIPAQLAYGSSDSPKIPENSNLIFDIILFEVYPAE